MIIMKEEHFFQWNVSTTLKFGSDIHVYLKMNRDGFLFVSSSSMISKYIYVTGSSSNSAVEQHGVPQFHCVRWKYSCQQLSTATPLCCVPSAVQWVRLWVWHRVSSSGSAVLWHQCQAHPGSANTVEGELARPPVWVGNCGFWWHFGKRSCMPAAHLSYGHKQSSWIESEGFWLARKH